MPRYSDERLREFVLGVCDGRIFTSVQVKDPNLLGMVFMVIALGGLSDLTKAEVEDVGCIWEWMDKAGPRSINGLPIFTSCHIMGKADFLKADRAIRAELERRKNIEI